MRSDDGIPTLMPICRTGERSDAPSNRIFAPSFRFFDSFSAFSSLSIWSLRFFARASSSRRALRWSGVSFAGGGGGQEDWLENEDDDLNAPGILNEERETLSVGGTVSVGSWGVVDQRAVRIRSSVPLEASIDISRFPECDGAVSQDQRHRYICAYPSL